MIRRQAMLAIAGATLPLAVAARESGANAAASLGSYPFYEVLQLGAVAKLTSSILLQRTRNGYTATFASLEVIEQTAAAQALTANYSPPAPKLTAAQKAIVAKVQNAPAASLDYVYVGVQIQGHQSLLAIQQAFLGPGPSYSYDIVKLALLLQSNIRQHLIVLAEILPLVSA